MSAWKELTNVSTNVLIYTMDTTVCVNLDTKRLMAAYDVNVSEFANAKNTLHAQCSNSPLNMQ